MPTLISFDIFGTVVDWKRGLEEAVVEHGVRLGAGDFDRLIDLQAELEQQRPGRRYRDIVAESLVRGVGLTSAQAQGIGESAGRWPLFGDSRVAMHRLSNQSPLAAMTNSDVAHGDQVQAQLGFRLRHWFCAEELGAYKPDAAVWHETARRSGVSFGRDWWHVSAYADYDLNVARSLGLTCILVRRPHCRTGDADLVVENLEELADWSSDQRR